MNQVSSATFDQRSGGDEWHLVGHAMLRSRASVRLRCDDSAPCLADALHVRSDKRYNDGSPADVAMLQHRWTESSSASALGLFLARSSLKCPSCGAQRMSVLFWDFYLIV